jgi:hypothetical protein
VRHVEDIPFERIRPTKATAQEKKFTDMQAAMQSADKSAIVGRCVACSIYFPCSHGVWLSLPLASIRFWWRCCSAAATLSPHPAELLLLRLSCCTS